MNAARDGSAELWTHKNHYCSQFQRADGGPRSVVAESSNSGRAEARPSTAVPL